MASDDLTKQRLEAVSSKLGEIAITGNGANGSASSPPDNTGHEYTSPGAAQAEDGGPFAADEAGAHDPDQETDIGPALFPPILESMEILGYVEDKNGIIYSRDIGCSTTIHDEVYFIFGNTICRDSAGKSVGTTSNTIAYVEDRAKILESKYGEISDNGIVKAFVPLNDSEIRFQEENKEARVVFRMTGGAVDIGVVGIVWFQILIEYENGDEDYRGIGQARLSTYSDGRIIVDRLDPLLFGPHEPRIGSFSTLYYNSHVYLWSDRDGQIILARVFHLDTAHPERYKYWSGKDWVPRWHDAQPIPFYSQHGAIIHTQMFGKDMPFLFAGVDKRGYSTILIGAAAEIQGPFTVIAICKARGIDHDEKSKYCVYPHLFASNIPKRELIVTWSEHSPGGVIAAKLKFEIDEVAAIKEADERKRAAEEQEARRLASIAEQQAEQQEARDRAVYGSEEDNDPRPKRDRSEGRLKNGYILTF